jgi:hypothetical protein
MADICGRIPSTDQWITLVEETTNCTINCNRIVFQILANVTRFFCWDQGIRRSGDQGIRGSGDQGIRGSGDHRITGSLDHRRVSLHIQGRFSMHAQAEHDAYADIVGRDSAHYIALTCTLPK